MIIIIMPITFNNQNNFLIILITHLNCIFISIILYLLDIDYSSNNFFISLFFIDFCFIGKMNPKTK
jgi:hypothetical protein